nr:MAG TPA: hypothetical protein [Caudoviricetes sp.]
MQDVSATGVKITVITVPTYPQGFEVSEFADNADPLDFPPTQIADYGMGVNGDLVTWTKPVPLEITLNVIPNTDADKNLGILYDMNRAAKGKISAQDLVTLVASYPDGTRKIFSNGKLISGVPANGVSSDGRIKTKEYKFVFENKIN